MAPVARAVAADREVELPVPFAGRALTSEQQLELLRSFAGAAVAAEQQRARRRYIAKRGVAAERQLKLIGSFTDMAGFEVVGLFPDFERVCQFRRLLEMASSGARDFCTVLVYDPSVLGDTLHEACRTLQRLRSAGVRVLDANGALGRDGTPAPKSPESPLQRSWDRLADPAHKLFLHDVSDVVDQHMRAERSRAASEGIARARRRRLG